MSQTVLHAALLDSIEDPILFADCDHVTRYMNAAAVDHYSEGRALIGRSLLDCHNEESCRMIHQVFEDLQKGATERLITDTEKWRIWMRAVRAPDGNLLGYYERYGPPRNR